MGLLNSKQWEEMTEMQDAEKERQNKDKNTEVNMLRLYPVIQICIS